MANFEFLLKENGQQNNTSSVTFIYQFIKVSLFQGVFVIKGHFRGIYFL